MSATLPDKIDAAYKALIAANLTAPEFPGAPPVYTGKDSSEKAAPCIVCATDITGDEDPKGSGNFPVSTTISVKQSAVPGEDGSEPNPESPKESASGVSAEAFAILMVDDLAAKLTAAGDGLTIFPGSIQFGAAASGQDESGLWVDTLQITALACGSALP